MDGCCSFLSSVGVGDAVSLSIGSNALLPEQYQEEEKNNEDAQEKKDPSPEKGCIAMSVTPFTCRVFLRLGIPGHVLFRFC
eukprot:m.164195 g.164195  ORF g.164195 m.164195 type:complete len:81 (-) comp31325_c1_seq3:123-365(-)